jgi:urease gamma subunit
MMTKRENQRLNKIRRAIESRRQLSKADASWMLDLAKREGTALRTDTIKEAARQGYDISGIKTIKE